MTAPLNLTSTLRRAVTPVARAARRSVLPRVLPHLAHRWPSALHDLRVVGLLSSSSGLGKSARLCLDALGRASYGVSGVNVASLYDSDDGLPFPPSAEGRKVSCNLARPRSDTATPQKPDGLSSGTS